MDVAALTAIAGGANADAVACAAREADWRALRWTAVRQDLGVPVLEVRGVAPVVHCDRLVSV